MDREAMPRFYVHHEGSDEATLIVTLPAAPPSTVDAVCRACAARFDREHGTALRGVSLELTTALGVRLRGSDTIQAAVKTGDDLWLAQGSGGGVAPPAVEEPIEEFSTEGAAELAAATPAPAPAPARENPYQAALAARKREKVAARSTELQDALRASAEAMAQRNYRTARQLHDKVFRADRTNAQARREAALIDMALEDFDGAEAHINKALGARPRPTDPELYVVLGDALRSQHEYDDAVDAYRSAIKLGDKRGAQWVNDVKILLARA